jgi:oligopeptide transport system substrate-binding protein
MALLYTGCEGETAVEEATRKGIFLMGNSAEPKGLDPHIVSGVLENNIISSLFEGLVLEHPSQDGVALPGVAEKWYPTDPQNPTEWIFELRKDAKWSDGHPLTAEDFLFSFRRILTPELASDYAFMLFYIRDAEAFHKSQRAYLLCRNDDQFPVEWDTLKEVNFEPI